jgi:serine/threonine-protein kinase
MRSCPHCLTPYSAQIEFCGLDGNKLETFETDPLVGKDLDRYRITAMLGDGAMARVYSARHQVLDREYAVKVLFGEIACDRTLAERFRREAQVISKLNHPNVVSILDFGTTTHGLTFLTMELVKGRTLRELIKSGIRFTPERTIRLSRQVAAGLEAAHGRGFIHRDLKPANIMVLSGDGGVEQAKILDFGLVRVTDPDTDEGYLTRTGQFIGTPIYMSPEQIIGGDITPRADLYALGVTMYEMLEGRPPFRAKRLSEIRQMHLSHRPPAMRPMGGLEVLVEQLLAKDSDDRPDSATLLIQKLDALATAIGNAPTLTDAPADKWLAEVKASVGSLLGDDKTAELPQRLHLSEPPRLSPLGEAPPPTHAEIEPVEPAAERLSSSISSIAPGEHSAIDGALSDHARPRRSLLTVIVVATSLALTVLAATLVLRERESKNAPPIEIAVETSPPPAPHEELVAPAPAPAKEEITPEDHPSAVEEAESPESAPDDHASKLGDPRRARRAMEKMEASLARELQHRGLTLDDLRSIDSTAQKAERWRAAKSARNATAMATAYGPLSQAIKTATIDAALLRRRLDAVSERLGSASTRVPMEKLRPLEDRYLEAAKAISPHMSADERSHLFAKLQTLLRDIAAAEKSP